MRVTLETFITENWPLLLGLAVAMLIVIAIVAMVRSRKQLQELIENTQHQQREHERQGLREPNGQENEPGLRPPSGHRVGANPYVSHHPCVLPAYDDPNGFVQSQVGLDDCPVAARPDPASDSFLDLVAGP